MFRKRHDGLIQALPFNERDEFKVDMIEPKNWKVQSKNFKRNNQNCNVDVLDGTDTNPIDLD